MGIRELRSKARLGVVGAALILIAGIGCGGGEQPSTFTSVTPPPPPPIVMPETPLAAKARVAEAHADFTIARALREEDVQVQVARFGQMSLPGAVALTNAGRVYAMMGDYNRAVTVLDGAAAIAGQVGGPSSLELASSVHELGRVLADAGDFKNAMAAAERARRIREERLGAKHPDTIYSNLVETTALRESTGTCLMEDDDDYEKQVDAAVGGAAQSVDNTDLVVMVYTVQGACRAKNGQIARAEERYRRAVEVRQREGGAEGFKTAIALGELGEFYAEHGDVKQANTALRSALGIFQKLNVLDNPIAAQALVSFALLHVDKRDQQEAGSYLRQAIKSLQKTGYRAPPRLAWAQNLQAVFYWALGDLDRATVALGEWLETEDYSIEASFDAWGSTEPLGVGLLAEKEGRRGWPVSLQALHPTTAGRKFAMQTLMRRKGADLRLLGREVTELRAKHGADEGLVREYLRAERAWAAIQFEAAIRGEDPQRTQRPPGLFSPALEKVELGLAGFGETPAEELKRSYRQAPPQSLLTVDVVAQRLPPDAALLELVEYVPADLRSTKTRSAPPRYAAFLMKANADVAYFDLGDASALDRDVNGLLDAISNPRSDPKPSAQRVHDAVFAPLRHALGDTRRIFIAPAGRLAQVPWSAFIDPSGNYLVRDWDFTYLTSGSELAESLPPVGVSTQSVVMANPDFGPRAGLNPGKSRGLHIDDLSRVPFPELPATAAEGRAAATVLGARFLTGAEATHSALNDLHGPRVLHLATHGFFLEDGARKATTSDQGRGLDLDDGLVGSGNGLDAFLRAGLAFAGANAHRPNDSGLLSAQEALWLDLRGTELVVLSACETGRGDVSMGMGIRGLPQAMLVAGARALVMSLWSVNDAATRDLMTDFYGAFGRGEPVSNALRLAQNDLLKAGGAHAHPYYWAAFIPYGRGAAAPARR